MIKNVLAEMLIAGSHALEHALLNFSSCFSLAGYHKASFAVPRSTLFFFKRFRKDSIGVWLSRLGSIAQRSWNTLQSYFDEPLYVTGKVN